MQYTMVNIPFRRDYLKKTYISTYKLNQLFVIVIHYVQKITNANRLHAD